MSDDKAPTLSELVKATGLKKEDVEWLFDQLRLGSQTPGVVTRVNASPVSYLFANGVLSGVTVAGAFLIHADSGKHTVKYVPLNEAVITFTKGDRLVVALGSESVDVSLKDDEGVLGVTLGRVHEWIRNMVVDYRRT